MAASIQPAIYALNRTFGELDNDPAKWADTGEDLAAHLPEIEQQLTESFNDDQSPVEIFRVAVKKYRELAATIQTEGKLVQGYHHLRFYILLQAFLAACRESLDKAAIDDFDDPADLVRRSNYAPYFYARAVLTPDDVKEMLDADISRLRDAPLDRSGIVLAMRVRKGTVLALTETFCPLHPTLYPLVAELESIQLSKDPAVISEMIEKLTVLRSAVS